MQRPSGSTSRRRSRSPTAFTFATTSRYLPLLVRHLPDLVERAVVLDMVPGSKFTVPSPTSPSVTLTENVLTLLMLPLAGAMGLDVARSRDAMGAQGGRRTSGATARRASTPTALETAAKAHPAFFRDRNYGDYYDALQGPREADLGPRTGGPHRDLRHSLDDPRPSRLGGDTGGVPTMTQTTPRNRARRLFVDSGEIALYRGRQRGPPHDRHPHPAALHHAVRSVGLRGDRHLHGACRSADDPPPCQRPDLPAVEPGQARCQGRRPRGG